MKLLNLAKKLDFTEDFEYYNYCIDSYFNGNFKQCKKLFEDMEKKDKKGLLDYISQSYNCRHEVYNFYFAILFN